jgi:antitoxin (DNA-binding transcriptional repressor) of toxin-antitoxin stability system
LVVLRVVERGEKFIMTNNGRPVAEIGQISQDPFEGIGVERAIPGARFAALNPVQIDSEETALEALLLMRGVR